MELYINIVILDTLYTNVVVVVDMLHTMPHLVFASLG